MARSAVVKLRSGAESEQQTLPADRLRHHLMEYFWQKVSILERNRNQRIPRKSGSAAGDPGRTGPS